MLLAELNIRHTRRHMPTRRVAVDDGYLPTNGAAFGGVLIGAVVAEHVGGLDDEQLRRARPARVRRPQRAHGAEHRAALPTPDRHPRARPVTPPHHGPRGGEGIDDPGARARPPRPGRAAGDRRDHGGLVDGPDRAQGRAAVRRGGDRPPGRDARGPRGAAAVRGASRHATAAPGAVPRERQPPSRRGRRVARRPVGASVGDGGARPPRQHEHRPRRRPTAVPPAHPPRPPRSGCDQRRRGGADRGAVRGA